MRTQKGGAVRIVAGAYRGRPLVAPAGKNTRPTTDRVREALFSSLFSLLGDFQGRQVLDAFAGSGALGLEALSRGAARAMFFERDDNAAAAVRKNAAACGVSAGAWELHRVDVLAFPFEERTDPFDLVFLDPPYATDPFRVAAFLDHLRSVGAAAPGAVATYEHGADGAAAVEQAFSEGAFSVVKQKKYGKSIVSFLEAIR